LHDLINKLTLRPRTADEHRKQIRGLLAMRKVPGLLLALMLISTASFSQIYRWKDKDGNIIVSTTPPPPGVECEKRETEKVPSNPQPRAAGAASAGTEFARGVEDVKVIMYVTDWCPVCHKARAFLKSLGVKLVEYDVEKDEAQRKEWLRKSSGRQAVPVIDIEGIILAGLNPAKIRAAIDEKRTLGGL
jgi:glutaredoxin